MRGEKTLESLIEIDGEPICIIRDIYEQNAPECPVCGLRKVCNTPMTESGLERVIEQINRQRYLREYYEDLNEFYDDNTYSEV